MTLVGVAELATAGAGELAFATGAPSGRAACILARRAEAGRTCVVVDDPKLAFIRVLRALHPPVAPGGIHPRAVVEGVVGADCTVGPGAVIEASATLGDRVRVGPNAVIGAGCVVGDDSTVHASAVLYAGVRLGRRCVVHAGAVLGAPGFGVHPSSEGLVTVPQVGTLVVGDGVEVGANTCIDRAFLTATTVGDGTRLDNLVQVGHNCQLGRDVVVAGQAGLSGSVTLGDGVVVAGQVGIRDHVHVAAGARIGAQSGVAGDLGPGEWFGSPALELPLAARVLAVWRRLPELWRRVARLERSVARLEADGDAG